MKLLSVKQIWTRANHNAFTDLREFKQHLFCCFREAENHISGDGDVRVLKLNEEGHILSNERVHISGADLRDPKLSISPDGKLLLLAYARFNSDSNQTLKTQPYCWFSTDGYSWSSPTVLPIQNEWLWRLSFHKDFALGFTYNKRLERLNLYKGNPLRQIECIKPKVLSKETHNLGYPNESDIIFSENGDAYALVRRDADSYSAQLGYAKAPYTQWQWSDLGHYIGGPAMIKFDEGTAIAAGRLWLQSGPKMALFKLDLKQPSLTPMMTLPSEGDSSYPGLVLNGDKLYVSYYSSHIDRKSSIYLAEVDLSNGLERT
ncbi:hypothetical protein EYS14_07870 [Alteromonadaceae bacterium M269]|nr:hypothetical protein EYS14_07870 [Alteromonadaceae bacterium M269]